MKTITLQELLAKGVSYEEYRKAANRGLIRVVRRGNKNFSTLIDANSPYLLHQNALSQEKASINLLAQLIQRYGLRLLKEHEENRGGEYVYLEKETVLAIFEADKTLPLPYFHNTDIGILYSIPSETHAKLCEYGRLNGNIQCQQPLSLEDRQKLRIQFGGQSLVRISKKNTLKYQ